MHTPESQIKAAILHPEEEIRLHAVCYFSEARCEDESIMPSVIQAVEKYGREATCDIVDAMHDLPQTEATVDWLINQLRRDYDMSDVAQENHCFRLAWALRKAPQPIFTKRFNDIITAKAFPEPLRQSLKERLDTFAWIGTELGRH